MKKKITMLLVIVSLFLLTACGGGILQGDSEKIVGTYYEAGGDYYGAQGDEAVQIQKNEDGSVDICWFKIRYENGISGEVAGYTIYGLAENVPIDEFSNETYVVLMGANKNDTHCVSFEDDETVIVEGKMWVFEKDEEEIDIEAAIKEYKEIFPEMEYQYSAFSEDVDILFYEDAFSNTSAVSFYRKWYEQYSYYTSEVGTLELQSVTDGIVDILFNGNDYCSFREDSYDIGDSSDYAVYQCENGEEFEFYPEYENSLTSTSSDIKPLIRFNQLNESVTDNATYIEYGADFRYAVNPENIEEDFDKEWFYTYNTFANSLNFLQVEQSGNELVVSINGDYYCSYELMDYLWDEEEQCVFYSHSTDSITYYPKTNVIKVETGEYAGQYKYVDSITATADEETEDESQPITEQNMETTDDAEQNYKWYEDYSLFANEDETVRIEVYGIDDNSFAMIWGDIYWDNEIEHNWQFQLDIVPDEIGADGEFIYKGADGRIVYYPYENYISVEMGDEGYDGQYHYYLY